MIFFDLDNTLSESKQVATSDMLESLRKIQDSIAVISGASLDRIKTQLPGIECVFMAQNGNVLEEDGELLWINDFNEKESVLEHISLIANEEGVTINEDMIEDRGSQISFSFVGHNAPKEEKNAFDPTRSKRSALLNKYPFTRAVIGGTTCIDYVPFTKGENIRRFIEERGLSRFECLYFGDALTGHGNDATVHGVIPTYQVTGPEETLNIIKGI